MPYCSKCGTQNPDTAKFCVNCGNPLSAATEIPGQPSIAPSQTSLVGSKVSFVASDGKTYSGTIKEIQGDQYKIKYDAFDFETWLTKNQFTVVGGSVTPQATMTPPSYSAVPNAQVTFSSTSTAASNPGSAILTHLGFWGSILLLIGFFTDWLNPEYSYGGNATGFTFVKAIFEDFDVLENELLLIMFIVILVIVISAILCFLYILGVNIGRGAFVFFKILPLLVIIGFIIYCVIKVREAGVDYDYGERPSAWKVLGIGIWLTLAGSVLLAISRSRR